MLGWHKSGRLPVHIVLLLFELIINFTKCRRKKDEIFDHNYIRSDFSM